MLKIIKATYPSLQLHVGLLTEFHNSVSYRPILYTVLTKKQHIQPNN